MGGEPAKIVPLARPARPRARPDVDPEACWRHGDGAGWAFAHALRVPDNIALLPLLLPLPPYSEGARATFRLFPFGKRGVGWRSRRLRVCIPLFAATRVVAASLSGPRLGSRVFEPDFHRLALAVIGEDFRAFCGGVFCKSQDRKPQWLAGETLARMNCGRSASEFNEGRGRIRNEGGERRGANSRAAPAFSNPTRIMDTAKWTTPTFPNVLAHRLAAGNRALLRNPASKCGDLVFLFCRRRRFRLSLRTVAPADDLLRVLKRHPVPRRGIKAPRAACPICLPFCKRGLRTALHCLS